MSISQEKASPVEHPQKGEDLAHSETLPTPPRRSGSATVSGRPSSSSPASETSSSSALLGQTIADRYTVLELLGQGGMSQVFLARHELLEKIVAIKVLKDDLATSKAAMERFHREAKAAANIGDPHIVEVTDYGFTASGDAFLVMERLEGQDLRALLRLEGPLKPGRAVAFTKQILRGLSAAHARGIIHRDLKAENIFITQLDGHEFIKILDFGISKLMVSSNADNQAITSTGVIMGTPQYIAPEQAQGKQDLDHRVDIYSIGVMLYEMITGHLPFKGESLLEVMMKHVLEEPVPPSARCPELNIPSSIEKVALKALSKDPAHRYSDAQQMLDALPSAELFSGGFSSLTLSTQERLSLKDQADRGHHKPGRWTRLALLAVVGLSLGSVLLYSWLGSRRLDLDSRAGQPPPATAVAVAKDTVSKTPSQSGQPKDLPTDRNTPSAPTPAEGNAASSSAHPTQLLPPSVEKKIQIQLLVSPISATIFWNNERVGQGTFSTKVLLGTQVTIRAEAPGYQTLQQIIDADQEKTITLKLQTLKPTAHSPEGDLQENPYR